jgi:hypothetical protein
MLVDPTFCYFCHVQACQQFSYLVIWRKDCNTVCRAWRKCKITNSFNMKLVPNLCKISALIKLNLIRYSPSTILFIMGVLKIPICLRFLYKFPNKALIFITILSLTIVTNPPNFKILNSVAIFILCRLLPGNDIGPKRRETDFKNLWGCKRGNNATNRCINNINSNPFF